MSLSIYVEYKTCPHCGRSDDQQYDLNITHNLGKMAEEAGIYKVMWLDKPSTTQEILPVLVDGYLKLKNDPDKFKKFNPDNGWGSYEALVEFVEKFMKACAQPGIVTVRR